MSLHNGFMNHLNPRKSSSKLLAALPISLASLCVVLVIPNCQQTPPQLIAKKFDSGDLKQQEEET